MLDVHTLFLKTLVFDKTNMKVSENQLCYYIHLKNGFSQRKILMIQEYILDFVINLLLYQEYVLPCKALINDQCSYCNLDILYLDTFIKPVSSDESEIYLEGIHGFFFLTCTSIG